MSFIIEWLTNIILLILLATILELILPKNALQKYVKMVVGLLLLIVLLQPLFSIFTQDFDEWLFTIASESEFQEKSIEESINLQKKEIELGQSAYISEQMAFLLTEQVDAHLEQSYSLKISEIEFELKENHLMDRLPTVDDIAFIRAHIDHIVDAESGELPEVKEVALVKIDTSTPLDLEKDLEEAEDPILEDVKEDLAKSWEVPKETLSVVWKGGASEFE
ncbi:stage III sporulation protein AF [Alkalihalobacillus sp. 1P02AB]|uniref:stage III sporulation protein AF n=1 Tax=Alkalihalobacillus sp. 1P02AB TaxID=3132260 RepID=UPI0039A4943A